MALSGASLLAAPPGSHLHGNRQFTTRQNLWVEDFSLPNGTTADSGATAWSSNVTYDHAVFGVYNNEFEVNNISINGLGTWASAPISIAGKTNVQVSAAVRSAGSLENDGSVHTDYIRFYYKVDGGAEVLFSDLGGIINNNSTTDSTVLSTGAISGSTVQIIIRAKATATDEFYYFDNVTVMGASTCTGDAPVGLTATVSQQLTCYVTTVNLNGSSTTPGVTYNWTGPNGFTAATAQAQATAGGIYTLHVTNPANGCSQTLPLTVSQNIAPPANVTAANSGPLTCDVTEVTLTGSTSTVNAGFEWDGPNGYQSFTAQDVATDPGSYVLTVTNFDNGCTLPDTTTVQYNCAPARRMPNAADTVNSALDTNAAFTFNVYPNPFSEKAFIAFKSPNADVVTIQLYNNNGVSEKLLFSNRLSPNQPYQLSLGGLPAGMHYVVIRVNNHVYTRKLVSVK